MPCQISPFGRLPDAAAPDPVVAERIAPTGEYLASPLVGYVRNPRSHRNKGHDAALEGRADVLLAQPRTRAELETALAGFAERGIDMLAISGGDGTVRDVLTRGAPLFGDDWPAIAVLPQGKTNALALDLGIERRWSVDDALASLAQARTMTRRPIVVEEAGGGQRRRFGFIFGAGVFNAAIDTGQVAHRFGAFQSFAIGVTAVFGIAQALFGFGSGSWRKLSRMTFTDAATGQPLVHSDVSEPDQRYMAGFTTLRTFPLGMKLFAGVEDMRSIGWFLIDAPLRRALALVPAAAMGWQAPVLERLGMFRGSGDAFDVTLDDGFILDGERFPAGVFRVSAGPELRFVTP